jgi:hypothetical protein
VKSLKKITNILEKYADLFHLSPVITRGLHAIIEEMERTEIETQAAMPVIYIYPAIDDILDGKVFTWKYGDKTYIVPLWHHDMIFDIDVERKDDGCAAPVKREICIKCIPILQNHFSIHDTTIQVNLVYKTSDLEHLLNCDELEFYLGEKRFTFCRHWLCLEKKQTLELKNCGIPLMDKTDMLRIGKRGSIKITVYLEP